MYAIKKFPTESATDRETMGSRRKIWCRSSREGPEWLFKYPRAGSGEHWAEKIAAEVASRLDIQSAVVELAEYGGEQGSVSASFTPEKLALLHGNELLAVIMDYDINKRHGQSDHSLKNIFRVLTVADATFEMTSPLETVKQQFAGYLVLDALIGNTDRHHQNWGLLGKRTPTGFRVSLAPSFDHAILPRPGYQRRSESATSAGRGPSGSIRRKHGVACSWRIPLATARARSIWCAGLPQNTRNSFGCLSSECATIAQGSRGSCGGYPMTGCRPPPRTSRWRCWTTMRPS